MTDYQKGMCRDKRQSLNLKPEHFSSECQEIEVKIERIGHENQG